MLIHLSNDYLIQKGVLIDLRYGSTNNFTGHVIYQSPKVILHQDAALCLEKAIYYGGFLDLRIKIFDAFRPNEAQKVLWSFCSDPDYVAPVGTSNHARGVAIDLTLCHQDGTDLDMGTGFDDFSFYSHHDFFISAEANRNRFILLGVMYRAGFVPIKTEWWHYQLPNTKDYPIIDTDEGMMDVSKVHS